MDVEPSRAPVRPDPQLLLHEPLVRPGSEYAPLSVASGLEPIVVRLAHFERILGRDPEPMATVAVVGFATGLAGRLLGNHELVWPIDESEMNNPRTNVQRHDQLDVAIDDAAAPLPTRVRHDLHPFRDERRGGSGAESFLGALRKLSGMLALKHF